MRIYKRGNTYYCNYGKQHGGRRSLETSEKAEAIRRAKANSIRKWDQASLGIQQVTWSQAMLAYLNECKAHKSLETIKIRLRWLHKHLNGTWLRDIAPGRIESLIAECSKGRAPGTVNRVTAALSAVLHLAKRREWISSVPYIRKLDEGKGSIRWISHEEAARLLSELPPHLNAMAAFTLATGLRASNVQYLQWQNVSIERRTLWVNASEFKSGKTHAIPLSDDAMTILRGQEKVHEAWVFPYEDHPVDKVSTKAWYAALKRAGIENFRWHDLRHTWASWEAMRGVPLDVLMKLGGWSSLDMVMRYAHLSEQHIARYVQNAHRPISADQEKGSQVTDSMGWLMGLEPTTTGITKRAPNNYFYMLLKKQEFLALNVA